jgi:excisionase family DNA binding protein
LSSDKISPQNPEGPLRDELGGVLSEYLTLAEVAKLLKISHSTAYAHWRELGGIKIGGLIRFRRSAIERLFEENEERETMVLSKDDRRGVSSGRWVSHKAGGPRRRKVPLPKSENGLW